MSDRKAEAREAVKRTRALLAAGDMRHAAEVAVAEMYRRFPKIMRRLGPE